MVSCQKCRQPISPSSFPNYDPSSRSSHSIQDSSILSPSTYDLLSHSERYPQPQPPQRYQTAMMNHRSTVTQRVIVPPPPPPQSSYSNHHQLGPTDSFVVLTDSVFRPTPFSSTSQPPPPPPPPPSIHTPTPSELSLNSRLQQLTHLSQLLSSTSSIDHPLCLECSDYLVNHLLIVELDQGKKERDKLLLFEKEVIKKRSQETTNTTSTSTTTIDVRESLEKDISKLKKAELLAINELKSIEQSKEELERELKNLELEEEELKREEAEFWTEHSKYIIERDVLQSRQNSLITRFSNSQKELEKLQRTNVYNDTFCIGQESTLGTINSLRLGRLPTISPPVEWSEINAALGHTLLLLHTISLKFGMTNQRGGGVGGAGGFKGWKLKCLGSFSKIVKVDEETGKEGESYELYGSSDLSISRVLQNRRFDFAMVAFLDCLRQLIEFVCERDRSVRIPHRIVKDKIGDVSIKYQFGSDETWSRALRHVLLDLKILLGRASI